MPANKDKIISLEQKINNLQKELNELKDLNDQENDAKTKAKTTSKINLLPPKNILLRRRAAI
jgi:TolA-binding protein